MVLIQIGTDLLSPLRDRNITSRLFQQTPSLGELISEIITVLSVCLEPVGLLPLALVPVSGISFSGTTPKKVFVST